MESTVPKVAEKEICERYGTEECPARNDKFPLGCGRYGLKNASKRCGFEGFKSTVREGKMIYIHPDGTEELERYIDDKVNKRYLEALKNKKR